MSRGDPDVRSWPSPSVPTEVAASRKPAYATRPSASSTSAPGGTAAPLPTAVIVAFVMTIVLGTPSAPGRATIEAPVMASVDVRG